MDNSLLFFRDKSLVGFLGWFVLHLLLFLILPVLVCYVGRGCLCMRLLVDLEIFSVMYCFVLLVSSVSLGFVLAYWCHHKTGW